MQPTEPSGGLAAGRSSPLTTNQHAGDHATQIGSVAGGVVFNFLGSNAGTEVTLDLAEYRRHQLARLLPLQAHYTRLDADSATAVSGQDFVPLGNDRIALAEILALHRRLIVLGGSGAGKTTSLLFLMGSVLSGSDESESLAGFIPVFIELGRFRLEGSTSPLDALLTLIAEALFLGKACSAPPPPEGVREILRSFRFLVLLDGLNEASAGLRVLCLKAADDLARLYTEQRFVVSSRPHGFSPPPDWSLVLLRELEDTQVAEFLQRATEGEAGPLLLGTVRAAGSPLFRLPLFLSLLVRLSGSPLNEIKRKAQSRSGLVAHFAESLLRRDLSRNGSSPAEVLALDRLRDALERLAHAFQLAGQVLPLAEARIAIALGTADANGEQADEILHMLCERGLLATDGHSVRFWHQVIQEYFYAGGFVRRWRGSKRHVGRLPWPLRRLAAKSEAEESLRFVAAHLGDEEAAAALRSALPINPALAISWADDLSLEGRAARAANRFRSAVRSFALAARRYSRLANPREQPWSGLASLAGAGILLCLVFLPVLGSLLAPLANLRSFEAVLLRHSVQLLVLSVAFAPFLDALLRCPPEERLEALLGAIPGVREPSLRRSLDVLAGEIAHSKLARRDVQALAQGALVLDAVSSEELAELLRSSGAPYVTTRLMGYLDTPLAVPLLVEILSLNNTLSIAALEALVVRARRMRRDRQTIERLFWAVWNDESMDIKIRQFARGVLRRSGKQPGGEWFLLRYFMLRFLMAAGILGAGILLGFLGLVAAATSFFLLGRQPPDALFGTFWLVYLMAAGVCIWWDALRIGVRPIEGYDANLTPLKFALASILTAGLLIPVYLLNRKRLRRDATRVDWVTVVARAEESSALATLRETPSPF